MALVLLPRHPPRADKSRTALGFQIPTDLALRPTQFHSQSGLGRPAHAIPVGKPYEPLVDPFRSVSGPCAVAD